MKLYFVLFIYILFCLNLILSVLLLTKLGGEEGRLIEFFFFSIKYTSENTIQKNMEQSKR